MARGEELRPFLKASFDLNTLVELKPIFMLEVPKGSVATT